MRSRPRVTNARQGGWRVPGPRQSRSSWLASRHPPTCRLFPQMVQAGIGEGGVVRSSWFVDPVGNLCKRPARRLAFSCGRAGRSPRCPRLVRQSARLLAHDHPDDAPASSPASVLVNSVSTKDSRCKPRINRQAGLSRVSDDLRARRCLPRQRRTLMVPPIISLTEIGAPGTIRPYDPQIRSFQPEHWFCDLGQHVAATGLASSPAAPSMADA